MMIKIVNSFIHAFNGIATTWKEEINFRIEVLSALFIFFAIFYFDFSFVESVICILLVTLVLAAEIVNTAIEDLCNKVEPLSDPLIGKVKDTMSAFVLIITIGALIVGVIVFYNHFIVQ